MFGRWVLVQGKGIPRNIRIGRHCVLVKHTGVQEGDDSRINDNTGFYGDKILYKNLNFFDTIFVPTFFRRRFRNALYGEKILSMGKCYVWARFRQTCLGSSMRGR